MRSYYTFNRVISKNPKTVPLIETCLIIETSEYVFDNGVYIFFHDCKIHNDSYIKILSVGGRKIVITCTK